MNLWQSSIAVSSFLLNQKEKRLSPWCYLIDVSAMKAQLFLEGLLSLWSLTYRSGFMSFNSAREGKQYNWNTLLLIDEFCTFRMSLCFIFRHRVEIKYLTSTYSIWSMRLSNQNSTNKTEPVKILPFSQNSEFLRSTQVVSFLHCLQQLH